MGRKSRNLGRYRIKCCGQEGFLTWKFPNGVKKIFPKNPPPTSFFDGKYGDPQEQIILYLLDCIFSIVAITAASPPWPMVASTQLSVNQTINNQSIRHKCTAKDSCLRVCQQGTALLLEPGPRERGGLLKYHSPSPPTPTKQQKDEK